MILPFAPRAGGLVAVLGAALLAGGPPQVSAVAGGRPGQEFKARADLVEVYATVSDRDGRFVTDLGRDEFVVREEGQVQQISTFAAGDQPVSLAIAVDRSWSMAGERLAAAQRAGRALLNDLGEQDRAMLVAIGSDVDVPAPLTNDRLAVDTALQRLDPWGSTALFDAVVTAFDAIEPAPGRRALVLISDGLERNSTRTEDDVLSRVRASDVLAYPVVLDRKVSPLLEQLAATTGGRAQRVRKLGDLPGALRRIASELRHQYLLGYQPSRPPSSGEYRRVTVEVRRPRHVVRARAGYLVR